MQALVLSIARIVPDRRRRRMSGKEKIPILLGEGERPAARGGRFRLFGVALVLTALMVSSLLFDGKERSVDQDVTGVDEINNAKTTPTNLLVQCDERFFTQTLDHFDVGAPTYQQRYFVCDHHFRPGGVMFFYVGNEADVELYLNHTGLMWENADEFGAMLVFAEHRYFGKSVPFGQDVTKHMRYLSTEQTLADYAVLITYLKDDLKRDIPVIGFGGSYGGMLGSWFRMKYPHIIDGVIAAQPPSCRILETKFLMTLEVFASDYFRCISCCWICPKLRAKCSASMADNERPVFHFCFVALSLVLGHHHCQRSGSNRPMMTPSSWNDAADPLVLAMDTIGL